MRLITILLGFVLLVGGNQLHWMFVGTVGFLLGARIAELIGFNQSEWQLLTFSLAAGLACTFLSYYLKKIMVILAGFLAGGYFITSMPAVLGWSEILAGWQSFVIAGALSSLLLILSYNLALIVVSTLSDRFIAHMLARNSRIEEDLIDQLFNSSEKRLARTLLLLARYGKQDITPTRLVPRLSQETLAEMVGTTRHA